MAMSIFTESEAPRDFRISSTESDGHYKKCLLCYTVKKNFYCPDCIRAGNFVHSSMPYSDRYAEKQAKLLRLKANRKHILERCEKLLAPKINKDSLLTEAKQSRDKIDLLRLAIEQRRHNIDEKRKELAELVQYNNELRLKLPRYQKRVSSLGKHSQQQRIELQNKISAFEDQAENLAALRRSRIRQLTKYIFPVYMTYDSSSDSIEDLEVVGAPAGAAGGAARAQLHVGAPWLHVDGSALPSDIGGSCEEEGEGGAEGGGGGGAGCGPRRAAAALALCAQLAALLAFTLDVRLPHPLALHEYNSGRCAGEGLGWRARRLAAAVGALCARAGVPPGGAGGGGGAGGSGGAIAALHALCLAAAADAHPLGRVEAWVGEGTWAAWEAAAGGAGGDDDDEPPEHLHWPEPQEFEELSCTPPSAPPAASLVTSAAASLASIWRGWTK